MTDYKYDIALSFAGEDRTLVEEIADKLSVNGVRVFYDRYEEANLWGKELYDHLSEIYQNKARYCIVFLSRHYTEKVWTNHERKNAQVRAMEETKEYILPIKLDDTEITSIRNTIGYLDFREHGIDGIVTKTLEKLGGGNIEVQKTDQPEVTTPIPLPKIRKRITQFSKDEFLRNGFEFIKNYFKKALSEFEKANPDIDISFQEITKDKFTTKLYVDGDRSCQCKIWQGGLSGSESIAYAEGSAAESSNDSSMNDYLIIDVDDNELKFKTVMGGFFYMQQPNESMTMEQAANYLWLRFIDPLTR